MPTSLRFFHRDPPITAELKHDLEQLSKPFIEIEDLQPLLDFAARHKLILLGEASHGTAEFYTARAAMCKKLIAAGACSFIGVEGDWPDCYRINQYVKGSTEQGPDAAHVLREFRRWPTWMWANEEVREFVEWLRAYNMELPLDSRIGFYGLDVYSLWDSIHLVMDQLQTMDPQAYDHAQKVFACFDQLGSSVEDYAHATALLPRSCEQEVLRLLVKLREDILQTAGNDDEKILTLEQNASIIRNAESYYRVMFQSSAESWNIRDLHMVETLERLLRHHGPEAQAVIWEHNTHIGDARYTDMAADGMYNLGQLARDIHGEDQVCLIGFGTYDGQVIAGRAWDAPYQKMPLPPARRGSWEDVLHTIGGSNRYLLFPRMHLSHALEEPRGQRAVGVVYDPDREQGNYVPTLLPRRYDAFVFIDHTAALHPLGTEPEVGRGDEPETYPSGL